MTEQKEKPGKGWSARVKLALVSLMAMLMAFVPSVSAMTFDLNGIQVVLSNMTGVILPEFLNLVIAALLCLVAISISMGLNRLSSLSQFAGSSLHSLTGYWQ